jgi:hypothetical protein
MSGRLIRLIMLIQQGGQSPQMSVRPHQANAANTARLDRSSDVWETHHAHKANTAMLDRLLRSLQNPIRLMLLIQQGWIGSSDVWETHHANKAMLDRLLRCLENPIRLMLLIQQSWIGSSDVWETHHANKANTAMLDRLFRCLENPIRLIQNKSLTALCHLLTQYPNFP